MLQFLPIYAQEPPALPFSFSKQASPVVFGVFLILFMFVLPGGVAGLLKTAGAALKRSLRRGGGGQPAVAPRRPTV
jgi:hypothetical protein